MQHLSPTKPIPKQFPYFSIPLYFSKECVNDIYNLIEVQMHKLFALSQLRTIQRLGVPQFTPDLYDQIIKNNNLVIRGQSLLYRLPREELKHVINIQCPINSLEQKYADAIIKASKELRKHGGVNQNRICGGCQFLSTCPQAKKELESKQIDDGLKDLLVLFYGLQNLAKPEAIFFRQWVSGYRLGDSIISAINDLSKEGVEIDEYDKCRIEGIKIAEERQAKKKLEGANGATGDQAKIQAMLKTVQKVRKPEKKPRANPHPQIKEAQEDAKQPLGKSAQQFSFQKQPQFQPKVKFSRDNPPRQNKSAFQPLNRQKGYQKIGQEGGYKKPYGQDNKFQKKPYNPDYKRENKPYKEYKQRSFDGPRKQPYDGKGNFQKKNDWNKERDYKPYQKQAYVQEDGNPKIRQMSGKPSYDKGERREGSYDPTKRAGSYGQKKDFKQRDYKPREPRQFNMRQDREYKPRQSRQPRQFQPREPRQDRQYKPREQRQNRQYKNSKGDRDPQAKSFNKENPHLSKWNIENESAIRSASRSFQQPRQFTPQPPRAEPKSQPRILQTESITFSKPASDDGARRGRSIRRNRAAPPTQEGEKKE